MASIRVRNGRYQVRWRQDGRALAETFADRARARRFLGLVIAAGERHPDGWVPGSWGSRRLATGVLVRTNQPDARASRFFPDAADHAI